MLYADDPQPNFAYYVYDTAGRLIEEIDDSGVTVARYVHGLGLISRESRQGPTQGDVALGGGGSTGGRARRAVAGVGRVYN